MKAKELRVDNWIHLDSMTDGTSVDLECGLFHMEEMGRSFKYKYSPILLTEEWFDKFTTDYVDCNTVNFGYGNRKIKQHKTFKTIKYEFAGNDSIVVYFNDEPINIKLFVHEWQNIHFVLTNTELNDDTKI